MNCIPTLQKRYLSVGLLLVYKYIADLFVLILYSVILNSAISFNRFFGSFIKVFYIPPSHLQLVTVLLLSFQFGNLLS